MSTRQPVAGAVREVVWSEERDAGDMFMSEVGVWAEPGGFVAYVKDGWGGGKRSGCHASLELAQRDTSRLWEEFYG